MRKLVIVALISTLALFGCEWLETHEIKFVVEATGTSSCPDPEKNYRQCADIQYKTGAGYQSWEEVKLPWSASYYGNIGTSTDETNYSLSAKNMGASELSVKILVDGLLQRSQIVTMPQETAAVSISF